MTFTSLASSSRGNCYVVSDGKTRVLLECGIPFRRLKKGLGFDLSGIRGCLVSHEHKDHSRCFLDLVKSGVEVFASEGTADALGCEVISPAADGEQFDLGSLVVRPFTVYHDAAEPLGYLIGSRHDGDRLVFATDTVNLGLRFPGVNLLALEANFDRDILSRCERMPEKVRERVLRTHMEIGTLCRYLKTLDLSQCRCVYLLHLSRAASHEGRFLEQVRAVVPGDVQVVACEE